MFISCPHCRELVATDPQTRLPPAMCPRCGGDLLEPSEALPDDAVPAGKRSFASFLQPGAQAAADVPPTENEATADVAQINDADLEAPETESLVAEEAAESAEPPVITTEAAEPTHDIALDEIPAATDVQAAEPAPDIALPRFTQTTVAHSQRPAAKWQVALLVALSLLLGLQILIADRARLAADENWRPVITPLCDALGCSVPTWHQPGAFTMLNRDVRPVANLPGALEAQATFRNDAAWPQAWPLLLLSLSDADGRVVGTRQFTPADYLGKDITQAELAPGQSAQVTFRLREPDAGVVAFAFDFR